VIAENIWRSINQFKTMNLMNYLFKVEPFSM